MGLNHAIQLVKAGKAAEAQQLLEPLLKADPRNITAWMWYVETWPTVPQKIKALELCRQYNPDDELARRALSAFEAQLPHEDSAHGPGSIPEARSHAPAEAPARPPAQGRKPEWELWLFIGALAAVAVCLVVVWVALRPAPNRNALAIGEAGQAPALDIPIQPPVELDFKTRAEVWQLRKAAVSQHPELISGSYQPSEAVFGQVEDSLPWWGITGHFYYGSGERSIEGPAEETRFLLNPYLLVAAEFDGLFYSWDTHRVTELDLRGTSFPFYCEAAGLRWSPREAYAEVTYPIGQCLARTNRWTARPLTLADAFFSLIAYNARDMNLNYLYVAYQDSLNLSKLDPPTSAYAIPHYLHRGGSCGYPGGCNNMSPDTPEISWIELTRLPARAVIRLWSRNPGAVERAPDMILVIHFQ